MTCFPALTAHASVVCSGRGRGTPAGEGLMSIHQQQLKAKLDRVAERKQAKAAAELARTLAYDSLACSGPCSPALILSPLSLSALQAC